MPEHPPSNVHPLPGATPLPATLDDTHAALVERVRAVMADGAISISQAAREIGRGVSQATLSTWLRGTYQGDTGAVDQRIERWLETRRVTAERSLAGAGLDRHFPLGVTAEIELALAHAQAAGDVVCIHGRSGAGKSTALRHYAATHSAATLVTMSGAVRTLTGLLGRIAGALGGAAQYPSALAAEDAVVERLTGRGALLIVDEAHHLRPALLDELRCLRDLSGAGLALAGDDALWLTLTTGRHCDQIVGRVGVRVALGAVTQGDALDLAGAVVGRALDGPDARRVLAAARAPGGLHALRRVLARAWVLAQAAGRTRIAGEDLATAAEGVAS